MRSLARKFDPTSVTRSRSSGNARIGSTVTGLSRSRSLNCVMHISFGMPLSSAEQDPHFPALQFQRTARSLALSAWIWCTASSTTIPSVTSVLYSRNSPPEEVDRQMLKVRVDIFFELSGSSEWSVVIGESGLRYSQLTTDHSLLHLLND